MKILYTKLTPKINTNVFEFVFDFEHGDADHHETQSFFYSMTEEEAIAFFNKSEEISQIICDSRSSGAFPKNFEDLAVINSISIPIAYDNYAKMYSSNYFAESGISETYYYNENGEKFLVQFIVSDKP